ncbi:MAG TPA: GTPase, partial [Pirellulales bacterium]|nr:GTPase [Pirellulales bacterium]
AGWWWLYEQGYIIAWAICAAGLAIFGKLIAGWAGRRGANARLIDVEPSREWAAAGEQAWQKIDRLTAEVGKEAWPLDDLGAWRSLLERVLSTVAHEFHPESVNPVLETPVPQIARIIELVAHDVGEAAAEKIPGSHILTVNDWIKLKELAGRGNFLYAAYYRIYRWARLSVNPLSALFRELADRVTGNLLDDTTGHARQALLDFVVRKAGFYAIELYSGRLAMPANYVTERSTYDAVTAAEQQSARNAEPLRVLIVGQVKAGKSSLVNALFGDVQAAVDVLPTTRGVVPLVLERDGLRRALILDTAGYGEAHSTTDPFLGLEEQCLACDLVLLVLSATTAAREPDRQLLEELRRRFQAAKNRRLPPILVVLTKIDQLRPFAEWNPPYDLARPTGDKARSIVAALEVVADEMNVSPEQIVPVCLLPERMYNVEEGLLPAVIQNLPDAARAKALRCLGMHLDEEYWRRLWRQAAIAGNLLVRHAASLVRPSP